MAGPEGRVTIHIFFTEHVDICLDSSRSELKTLGQKVQMDVMMDGGGKQKQKQ